jgi:hypothetical protein
VGIDHRDDSDLEDDAALRRGSELASAAVCVGLQPTVAGAPSSIIAERCCAAERGY